MSDASKTYLVGLLSLVAGCGGIGFFAWRVLLDLHDAGAAPLGFSAGSAAFAVIMSVISILRTTREMDRGCDAD